MPYIKQDKRHRLDWVVMELGSEELSSGELNYLITKILLNQRPLNYEDYQNLIGTLESIKQEFYRRKIAPYEDKKIEENGDVYE